MIKKSKKILISQQKFLLSQLLNHNPKCTIFSNENENFPKIDFLSILFKKYNLLIKKSKEILIYQQKFLLSQFLNHNPKFTIFPNEKEKFPKIDFLSMLF